MRVPGRGGRACSLRAGYARAVEQVDIVDEQDRVVGLASRARMRAENLWHRTVAVLCVNSAGHVYLHQRSHDKDLFPGAFDAFVSGCVRAGDSYLDSARRELEEELGISGAAPEPLCHNRYDGPGTRTQTRIYRVDWNGPVEHADGEIIWGAFVAPAEVEARVADGSLVPDGVAHLAVLRAQALWPPAWPR